MGVADLSSETNSQHSADANMELPADARVNADGDAIAGSHAHAASRCERALARRERSGQERLMRLKDAATDDEEWCHRDLTNAPGFPGRRCRGLERYGEGR